VNAIPQAEALLADRTRPGRVLGQRGSGEDTCHEPVALTLVTEPQPHAAKVIPPQPVVIGQLDDATLARATVDARTTGEAGEIANYPPLPAGLRRGRGRRQPGLGLRPVRSRSRAVGPMGRQGGLARYASVSRVSSWNRNTPASSPFLLNTSGTPCQPAK